MLPDVQRKGICRPCRESKVQCDRKKPQCTQCVSQNKQCGGYDMGHIFINVNSTGPPPVWNNRSQNAQKYLVLDLASQPQFPDISPSSQSGPSLKMPATFPKYSEPDPNNFSRMVDLFLNLYYRRSSSDKSSADLLTPGNECGGWRSLVPLWLGQSQILDTAIGAMAASFVGSQYQDGRLLDQARNMYLHALQMVQKALSEPNSSQRKDLLATTLVMSSTELFMSNGGGAGQISHIEGATKLLTAAPKTQSFEELHVYILNQGLFECLASRRRYTFSAPEHHATVRQIFSSPRTSRNDLYFQWCELILPLPNILNAADTLTARCVPSRSPTPGSTSAVLSILDDLTRIEQSLSPWYDRIKTSLPGPWTLPIAQPSPSTVPFPLHFSSIEVCTLYCLYWTSQVLILDARHTLYPHVPRSEMASLPAVDLTAQIAEYASLVCRAVHFGTHDVSFAAAENALAPLFIVASYYARSGDEERVKWCVTAFKQMARAQGIGYAVEKLDLAEQGVRQGSGRSGDEV